MESSHVNRLVKKKREEKENEPLQCILTYQNVFWDPNRSISSHETALGDSSARQCPLLSVVVYFPNET